MTPSKKTSSRNKAGRHSVVFFLFAFSYQLPQAAAVVHTASPLNVASETDSALATNQNPSPRPGPNYHLLAWVNTFVPGSGEALLGNPGLGASQFILSVGAFTWGYEISARTPLSLDGAPEAIPQYNRKQSRQQSNLAAPLAADALQEFGIKYHFTNTFNAYRKAAKLQGVTDGIDQSSTLDLFLEPFRAANLTNPWVYIPIATIAGFVIEDYITTVNGGLNRQAILTPSSNYLYGVNYLGVQSIGSGTPEEMFFRGFMQHEFETAIPSPFFSIPATTAVFAFSHAPGNGRYTAAVAGAYLGYLAHKNNGLLGQGIAVHFWGVVLLGIETILLTNKAEHTVVPTGFQVQINY